MSYAMELHQEHIARRERMGFVPPPPRDAAKHPKRRLNITECVDEGPMIFAPVDMLSPPSWKRIVQLVAAKHRLKFSDLISASRARPTVAARNEAIGLVHSHCRDMSLPVMGRLFGGRDHTTILHSLRRLAVQSRKKSTTSAGFAR